jgi:hypothetical protein
MKPTVRTHPNATVIELEGEADLATVPEFQKLVHEQMKAKVQRLIITGKCSIGLKIPAERRASVSVCTSSARSSIVSISGVRTANR